MAYVNAEDAFEQNSVVVTPPHTAGDPENRCQPVDD